MTCYGFHATEAHRLQDMLSNIPSEELHNENALEDDSTKNQHPGMITLWTLPFSVFPPSISFFSYLDQDLTSVQRWDEEKDRVIA